MKRSHKQIEGLLNQRPGSEPLREGFSERVAQGITGIEPGASPVAVAVMPASVKSAILLGAVGVIAAGVWVSSVSTPVPEPKLAQIPIGVQAEDAASGSIFEPLRDLGGRLALVEQAETGMFSEGRKLLADAMRVGMAFVSVFPEDWTEMIWSPGLGNSTDSDPIKG